MRVTIINKSDNTGGAAVVSRRLMEAMRHEGVEARMLVVEKLTDSPYVFEVSKKISGFSSHSVKIKSSGISRCLIKYKFFKERLRIFIANGFNRDNLFKIDTGDEGLPLWNHPLVKDADAIIINWVNQGMLSLRGFIKILKLGKPVIWTMHDMWEMTGICHHAGRCNHYEKECGNCPLLEKNSSPNDISHKSWVRKRKIYSDKTLTDRLAFVAVSSWLKEKAKESSLLKNKRIERIPNAFDLKTNEERLKQKENSGRNEIRILFGAARLDDSIKGLETLKETSKVLKKKCPSSISGLLSIYMFGSMKKPEALEGFELPVVRLGVLNGEENVKKAYEEADILVSASSYETLPGTLVEAQAYGCIPVSFNQGGQKDIIDNEVNGFLIEYSDNLSERANNLAEGILKAISLMEEKQSYRKMLTFMRESVEHKFSYSEIANRYISLIRDL